MRSIHLEAVYPASPAEVWSALTDPDELEEWLMPSDFRAEVGRNFTFTTEPRPGFDGIVTGKVLEVEPEQRLRYTWNGGGQKTEVVWELEPHGKGTFLKLSHTGFKGLSGLLPFIALRSGWKQKFERTLRERFGG